MADVTVEKMMIHIRYGGTSQDVPADTLDIGNLSSDTDVRNALARHLGVDPGRLSGYRVDREPTGNLTVRPEAVFG